MRAHTIILLATTLASSVLAEPEADIESPVQVPVGEINEDEDFDPPNVFQFIDVNGDKLLDKEELVKFFKVADTSQMSEEDFWTDLYKGDKDGDGLISWDEFSNLGYEKDEL